MVTVLGTYCAIVLLQESGISGDVNTEGTRSHGWILVIILYLPQYGISTSIISECNSNSINDFKTLYNSQESAVLSERPDSN